MTRSSQLALAALFGFALLGCRSSAPPPSADAGAVERAFEPLSARPGWRVGDEVVYAVELAVEEERRAWVVEIRLLAPPSEDGPMRATYTWTRNGVTVEESIPTAQALIRTDDGAEVRSRLSWVPAAYMERGLLRGCLAAEGLSGAGPEGVAQALDEEAQRAIAESAGALFAFFQVVQGNEDLARILAVAVQRPSLASLIANLGRVNLNLSADFTACERMPSPLPAPLAELECFRVPGQIHANDELALEYELVVASAEPPLHLAAGLLQLEGRHPNEPGRSVSVSLLAARRGSAPAEGEE